MFLTNVVYYRMEWKITKVEKLTANPTAEIFIKDVIASWNFSQLSIEPQFLLPGYYKEEFYVTIETTPYELTRGKETYVQIINVS